MSPRFVGPFEILKRIGKVAYELALPPSLSSIHGVFYVSMLRKYISEPSHVLSYESLDLKPNLSYEEIPIRILDKSTKELRNKRIRLVKVLWRNQRIEEATWEKEDRIQNQYPNLFGTYNFEDEIS